MSIWDHVTLCSWVRVDDLDKLIFNMQGGTFQELADRLERLVSASDCDDYAELDSLRLEGELLVQVAEAAQIFGVKLRNRSGRSVELYIEV